MPPCRHTHDLAQRCPSLATDTAGRDPRTEAWAAPGLAAACGHMLYKGKESELLRRRVRCAGRSRAGRRVGGPYVTTSS